MSPSEPPRRGNLPVATSEPNVSRGPHTLPPEAPTSPPPAMPMGPPKHLAGPRAPLKGQADPPRAKLDSREITTDSLLTELAARAAAEREARAEADALRQALDAARRAPPTADSLAPGAERKALIRLAYKLGTPLVLLMGAATAWLGAHTAKVEEKVDRVEETRKLDKVATDPLPEKVQTNERATVDCREWAAAWEDYSRQVWAREGIVIPQHPNAKPVTPIETRAPRHKPNAVNGAPTLEVLTLPPPLP